MEDLEVEDNLTKSPRDDRHYRYLKLANGLKVLVVSDATTEKAAAALSVRVGYLCDPDTIPGLAHFCEHMAFLGTTKYPSENDYMEFLAHHGGSGNAMTTMEFTTFYFDVASDHLMEALDRFSQFFISPLFTADATDREINAVDSENDKNLQDDNWRFRQVCHETSNPNHPYRRFGTGSKYTLKTRPQELGVDVREELLKYHAKYYSSNLMTLAIVGKEPLDELTTKIRELFSPIVNKNVPTPEFSDHPYTANELQTWTEYVPVKDIRQVVITFPIPDITEYYQSNPSLYVAHLVGHEGAGSLLSFLKSKHWCNTLLAGPELGAKGFMFFSVTMDLTEEGMELVEEVVTATFEYLAMLRSMEPQEWVFQECADLNALAFRFKEKEKPRSFAKGSTMSLHHYAPRDVLSGDYLITEFRPDLIKQLLGYLTPQSSRVAVIGQKFKGQTSLKEPWYGSEYNIRKIDADVIEKWSRVEHDDKFYLPARNEFIPTDFTLVPPPPKDAPKLPVLIQDTPMTKVWYKQDDTFFVPRVCINLKISSPKVYESPATCCMTSLFISLLCDALNEYAYDAELAGISYKICGTVYSLDVMLGGYHHKQSILLQKIVEKMSQFTVDPKRFDVFKELLTRQLQNFRAEQPYSHAVYYGDVLLDNLVWTKEEMAEALNGVSVEQFQEFILHSFFSTVHIEALIHGNISKERCLEVVSMVEETLRTRANAKPLPSPLPLHRQVQLPERSAYLYEARNEVHNCCCIDLYFQTGSNSTSSNMLLQLLSHTLKEPCFNKLRTKEQLGYIVASGLKRSHGVQGLRILIQSDKPAPFVEKRAEIFLQQFQEILKSMSTEKFEQHKKALAVERSVKPKKLSEECGRYWRELQRSEYHFNRDKEEVDYLMTITQEDLCQFFDEYIAGSGAQRRKLSVHVLPVENKNGPGGENPTVSSETTTEATAGEQKATEGTDGQQETLEETDSGPPIMEPVVISSFSGFKNGLSLYPQVKSYISTSL